jgi:hypothetical protein
VPLAKLRDGVRIGGGVVGRRSCAMRASARGTTNAGSARWENDAASRMRGDDGIVGTFAAGQVSDIGASALVVVVDRLLADFLAKKH